MAAVFAGYCRGNQSAGGLVNVSAALPLTVITNWTSLLKGPK